jgi:hypothetical protein
MKWTQLAHPSVAIRFIISMMKTHELIPVDVALLQVDWHILETSTEHTDLGLLDCADISIFH